MKIVIDIDEHEYTEIKEDAEIFRNKGITVPHLYKVIESGIPLPKGHGKIVDLGNIDKDRIEQYNPIIYLTVNGEYIEAVSLDYLNGLQAIIEEDKEVESEKEC